MKDQDIISEEELHEAASEMPAFPEFQQHMPTHLPGGFDGTEPGEDNHGLHGLHGLPDGSNPCESVKSVVDEEAPKKRGDLEKMNYLLRNRLRKISDIADKAVMGIRTDEEHNIALLGACTEIRQLVDFYKPREKPLDPAAPDVEELKKRGAKLKECNDRSYAKMNEIARIANECIQRTTHAEYAPGQYGKDYRTFGKAMCEIRKLVRESIADVAPDYEMLALQFARNSFDFSKFQEAMAAVASMKQDDFPGFYYTPGWLCDLAKKLSGSETLPPRAKPIDPSAPEVVNPSRLDDIGMQMDRTTVVDDDGVVCKIRRAGVLMMGIGRPEQLWEVDATKHPTYCRVMVFCDHRPIFDGKAFGKNLHRAGLLGLAVMIRFIQAQRKHQRMCRKAAVKKLIKEELA